MVEEVVPGSKVTYAAGGGPDVRCYRADFKKIESQLPGYEPIWTVRKGIRELLDAYQNYDLQMEDFSGSRYVRLKCLRDHIEAHRLDDGLWWRDDPDRSTIGR